jgi:5-dehydro-4-deoxyglucarate dehydratase
VPVIAGAGYGTAIATDLAKRAERAGADAILLLPPYLLNASQAGLMAHVEAVCRATGIGVIVYNRDNAILEADTVARLCERCPNLVGLKDGVGDIELMVRTRNLLGDRLVYLGGLPTAETFARPYLAMGVATYSSALLNFFPNFARGFYRAVRAEDVGAIEAALRDLVLPYTAIRNRGRGYAVSIVKAGVRIAGRPAGPVRPPLTELDAKSHADLQALMEKQGDRAPGSPGD